MHYIHYFLSNGRYGSFPETRLINWQRQCSGNWLWGKETLHHPRCASSLTLLSASVMDIQLKKDDVSQITIGILIMNTIFLVIIEVAVKEIVVGLFYKSNY